MRIRFNGPESTRFDPYDYAKLWVDGGKMRTDDPANSNKAKKVHDFERPEDVLDDYTALPRSKGLKNLMTSSTLF